MQLKQFITADDRAVSPVIGVILMVAITVILAAVIGTFVLGLGENVQSTSPSASFGFDFTDNTGTGNSDVLTITHESGDVVTDSRLTISLRGVTDNDGSSGTFTATGDASWPDADVSAGDTYTIDATGDLTSITSQGGDSTLDSFNAEAATVNVIWTSQSGDNSATLGTFSGPDA